MKTVIRNFLSVLRRFKMAMLLNLAGLTIAFAAFMVIMMQLDYDWTFAKSHPDSDRIYRVELITKNGILPVLSRPFIDKSIQSSAHIKVGTLAAPSFNSDLFFTVEKEGVKNNYREPVLKVYPNYSDVFEFDIVEGNPKALEHPGQVLIPLSLSKKIFGNNSAVGEQFKSDEKIYTVGGVYTDFPKNTIVENVIYYPMAANESLADWGNSSFYGYIRLDSPENKDLVADTFTKNFEASGFEDYYSRMGILNVRLTSIPDLHFITDAQFDFTPKTGRQTLLVLLAIAFIILLIAAINFTNFSTALAPMRIKSINTQKVLGAEEGTLRTSLVFEAILICIIAYLLSLGVVYGFAKTTISSIVTADLSLLSHPTILLITAAVALLTGFLAGIYPSWYITSFAPALVLKGSFGLSPKGRTLRNGLISIQFLASFALIICSIFMYLQNNYMQSSPLGYDKDELIITDLPASIMKNKEAYIDQLKSFSGVEDVTFSDIVLASSDQYMDWGRHYKDEKINFQCLPVDASFLDVMGISVVEGRDFRKEDEKSPTGTFIFNEKAQKAYNLMVGDKLEYDGEIVGIVPDIKFASFRTEVVPMAFYIRGEKEGRPDILTYNAYIKVKASSNMKDAMAHVQTTSQTFAPDFTFNMRIFDEVINGLYESENRLSSLVILFSLIAVLISMVGVFGLVVFESEYKRKEIGVRKVLGSTTQQILVMFNKHYFRILFVCFIISAPIAYYAISRWLENFAYKSPIHWWVFILAFLIVHLITSMTVTFQSWRVANLNPVESLKTE